RYVMVTTNCLTGEANYWEEKQSEKRVIDIVRASSSLPFVCPIAYVDGIPMLDGGIVDSIPLMRARRDGFTNNVVVLTRNRGYRKKIQGTKVPPFIYRKYPALRAAINRRSVVYNAQLELVERLEEAGEITVIRPQRPITVDRIERDIRKLTELYEEGYACAAQLEFAR
ncbi:patatin family protein, partial [Bacteroides sp.]